ncbi:MAG: hypothetical protein E7K43_20820 [Bacillus subtilis]|nr:hypothetical protein [Bacillus subtilis]
MNIKKVLIPLFVVAILSFSFFTPGPQNKAKAYGITQVTNKGYQSKYYGKWKNGVTGAGKATLTLSKTVTVSNSYTGTLTASKGAVSSAVGFNITSSRSTTASYSVSVPKGKKYTIQYRPVYKKYKAVQKKYESAGGVMVLLESKNIYPLKYDHLEYRYITTK